MPRPRHPLRLRLRLFVGKVRRQFLIVFRPAYVRRQMAQRQGTCLQCATCCNFAYPCPLLRPGNLCATYHTCRPRVCGLFPINQADLDDVAACGHTCGYRFDRSVSRGAPKLSGFAGHQDADTTVRSR